VALNEGMPEVLDNSMKYTIYLLHAKQIDNKRGDIPVAGTLEELLKIT
jgi:hypothetical protein